MAVELQACQTGVETGREVNSSPPITRVARIEDENTKENQGTSGILIAAIPGHNEFSNP